MIERVEAHDAQRWVCGHGRREVDGAFLILDCAAAWDKGREYGTKVGKAPWVRASMRNTVSA